MENYQPSQIETKWYEYWESNKFFSPDNQDSDKTYTIVIPPPNVTGSLHIGHALVNSLQDVIIRWKRMLGYKTLWLPGTDHAGIATQMVVDRDLLKQGTSKEELGREKFIEKIWEWKEQYGGKIFHQLRRLGASLDWDRERFTLDEGLSKAVRKCFVEFYKEGLIYRGDYIVNWCPKDKTAVSDLEVDHVDKEGTLTEIAYPLSDGSGELVVATTRPETMLGDTAIAVHPEDERYKDIIGKTVVLPLVKREIPVIADDFVDLEFGTGAVKVTPAHDPNDFAMGQRHNLPSIKILTDDAKMNDVFEPVAGMDRYEARKKVLELLKEEGAFRKQDKHMHAVGHCQRCQTVVEPMVSTQWFCKMKDMAVAALKAVDTGEIKFYPDSQRKIFHEWLDNIQDWCLSRQIWWGHRIPAFYCNDCGEMIVSEEENIETCTKCNSTNLRAETDVLDTWFSSGLFPFSTMGWPDKTEDLENFYPNSSLITGYDILFFWVARMVMMGIKLTGKAPFSEVFLNGLVRDKEGNKMSKTRGNVIDPLDIVDQYGADALRFTLTSLTVMGRDCKLSESILEGNRNFINKLWNATRFTLSHIERLGEPKPLSDVKLGIFDQWIINRMKSAANDVNRHLSAYRYNEAAKATYSFIWHEFCDWYLEIIKPGLFNKLGEEARDASLTTVVYILEKCQRMLHPIMPHVTEELWQTLKKSIDLDKFLAAEDSALPETIMLSKFPEYQQEEIETVSDAEQIIELVNVIRNIRGENNIKPNQKIEIYITSEIAPFKEAVVVFDEVIKSLGGVKTTQIKDTVEKSDTLSGGVGTGFEVFVDLAGAIDVEQEIKRLEKEEKKLTAKQKQLSGKLSNKGFLAKAPEAVIKKDTAELAEINDKLAKIDENLKKFRK